jgi:hypothetical protein
MGNANSDLITLLLDGFELKKDLYDVSSGGTVPGLRRTYHELNKLGGFDAHANTLKDVTFAVVKLAEIMIDVIEENEKLREELKRLRDTNAYFAQEPVGLLSPPEKENMKS